MLRSSVGQISPRTYDPSAIANVAEYMANIKILEGMVTYLAIIITFIAEHLQFVVEGIANKFTTQIIEQHVSYETSIVI